MNIRDIRVIIAEDHELFRQGLKLQLSSFKGILLQATASNGEELIELCGKYLPDVILIDIKMPLKNGLEASKFLRNRYPHLGIIALSMFEDAPTIQEFMFNGGNGYLQKTASSQELYEAIITVFNNEIYYCSSTQKALESFQSIHNLDSNPLFKFKDIELSIIQLICQGLTSKEIATKVFLSSRTVEGYRKKIQVKMNVENSAGIIKYAIENKLS